MSKIGNILKFLLPFLKTAAEKAFDKLPKETREELIKISKLVEVVKQAKGKDVLQVAALITKHTGFTTQESEQKLIQYLKDKGKSVKGLSGALSAIWDDAEAATEAGAKSLWSSMSNLISSIIENVDWISLLLGIGEVVYRNHVKGKIKI